MLVCDWCGKGDARLLSLSVHRSYAEREVAVFVHFECLHDFKTSLREFPRLPEGHPRPKIEKLLGNQTIESLQEAAKASGVKTACRNCCGKGTVYYGDWTQCPECKGEGVV